MNKSQKLVLLILLIVLLVLILRLAYSKYVNQVYAIEDVNIGKWIIKINGQDITEDINVFEISDFEWDEESHVKPPKVAPGMKGHFSISIDPRGTDVSIKYTIKIDQTKLTELSDIKLKITGIEENGVSQEINTDENGEIIIEKIIELSEIKSESNAIDNLRINVVWENLDTTEGNKKDTEVGKIFNTKIQMPVEVKVIQYIPNE